MESRTRFSDKRFNRWDVMAGKRRRRAGIARPLRRAGTVSVFRDRRFGEGRCSTRKRPIPQKPLFFRWVQKRPAVFPFPSKGCSSRRRVCISVRGIRLPIERFCHRLVGGRRSGRLPSRGLPSHGHALPFTEYRVYGIRRSRPFRRYEASPRRKTLAGDLRDVFPPARPAFGRKYAPENSNRFPSKNLAGGPNRPASAG
jgi:hypothetical protein